MSDNVESHTLALLREMRGEMQRGFAETHTRLAALEGRVGALEDRVGALEGRVAALGIGQAALSVDLKAVKVGVENLMETAQIIELDLAGIKKRVERIERHTGLVKA